MFLHLRYGQSISRTEALVRLAFRVGILQVFIGVVGILGSFAFFSSILTLACGAVALVTMRSQKISTGVSDGRIRSCSKPIHSGNLAIAALVFGASELVTFATLDGVWIPFLLTSICAPTLRPSDLINPFYYPCGTNYIAVS